MDRFWDLLEKSTIVSGILAVGVVVTYCYMTVTTQYVPEELQIITVMILGWFFGAKTTDAGYRALRRRAEANGIHSTAERTGDVSGCASKSC